MNQQLETTVYGENDLGISVSRAFLMNTPKIEEKEKCNNNLYNFRKIEKCRNSKSFNKNAKLINFDQESIFKQLSFIGEFDYKDSSDFSIKSDHIHKFEAGCTSSNGKENYNNNQHVFLSTILNENNYDQNDKIMNQTNECFSCFNKDLNSISFHIKISSTPKFYKKAKKSVYCKACNIVDIKRNLKDNSYKKIKLNSELKTLSKNDILKNTNFMNTYFKKIFKRKCNKKPNHNHDITTSTKKLEYKIRLKKNSLHKKTLDSSKSLKSYKKKENKKVSVKYSNSNVMLKQNSINFDLLNQNNFSNNFNQLGQLKVWYV